MNIEGIGILFILFFCDIGDDALFRVERITKIENNPTFLIQLFGVECLLVIVIQHCQGKHISLNFEAASIVSYSAVDSLRLTRQTGQSYDED